MEGFLILLRLCCLMASNFGYYNLLRKKTHLNISFIPVIIIGLQVSVLLLAGVLNFLLPTAVTMLAAGIILLIFDLLHGRIKEYKCFAAVSYAYMGVCFLALAIVLYNSCFFMFDDFSHWARIVRELMASNQFPNYNSKMVIFKTYPLGSSVYIYYCCLVAGTEEWIQMLIQAFMVISGLLPLFSCCRKHKLWLLIILIVFTNLVLVYNVPTASLLVDTLLPVIGMSAALITWNIYADSCQSEKSPEDIWLIAPLLVLVVMIKNPGFFFAVPAIMILAVMWRKKPESRLKCAGTILTPIAAIVIWRQHCTYVFPHVMDSKHSVSIEKYAAELSRKSSEEIADIVRGMGDFLLHHLTILYILMALSAIIVASLIFNKSKLRKAMQFSCFVIIGYAVYMAGICGMYIFSMPIDEAIILNEIKRYASTMDIAVFYLIVAFVLGELDEVNGHKRFIAVSMSMLAALILAWGCLAHWDIISGKEKQQIRIDFETIIDAYNIPEGAPCVICNSMPELEGYVQNLADYTLWSYLVCEEDAFVAKDLKDLNDMEYILMVDYENEKINDWIQKYYPEQYGNRVIVTTPAESENK